MKNVNFPDLRGNPDRIWAPSTSDECDLWRLCFESVFDKVNLEMGQFTSALIMIIDPSIFWRDENSISRF